MIYKRYNKIKKLKKTHQYLSTSNYSKIEPNINDIYIISKEGDRLDLYADQYYNDITKWTFIARANHIGKGTLLVKPGLQIRIPMNISKIEAADLLIKN